MRILLVTSFPVLVLQFYQCIEDLARLHKVRVVTLPSSADKLGMVLLDIFIYFSYHIFKHFDFINYYYGFLRFNSYYWSWQNKNNMIGTFLEAINCSSRLRICCTLSIEAWKVSYFSCRNLYSTCKTLINVYYSIENWKA